MTPEQLHALHEILMRNVEQDVAQTITRGGPSLFGRKLWFNGKNIETEEITFAQAYVDPRDPKIPHIPGERASIAELVAMVGRQACDCDGGLVQIGNFETCLTITQVCTRCNGFNSQRRRQVFR